MRHSFSVVTRTWAPEIILALDDCPQNFNGLLSGISGINDRILTERLRDLEGWALVSRQVVTGPPVRVRYGLTVAGRAYVAPLKALQEVAQ